MSLPDVPAGETNPHRRVAVVFDFDDTLLPDSTSALVESSGIEPRRFWENEVAPLIRKGYDPTLAWLSLLLAGVGPNERFGLLNRERLRDFGVSQRTSLYTGVSSLASDLKAIGRGVDWSVDLFVVSGGLEDIVRGTLNPAFGFTDVYGSLLDETGDPRRLSAIMRAVTFTEKTRYLFEISKGISSKETLEQPYAVNKEVADLQRPIPLDRMIYVGDGLTDIPCFSLLSKAGGVPFGVFDPRRHGSAKKALRELAMPRRTRSLNSPKFGPHDDLGALLRQAVADICGRSSVGHERG